MVKGNRSKEEPTGHRWKSRMRVMHDGGAPGRALSLSCRACRARPSAGWHAFFILSIAPQQAGIERWLAGWCSGGGAPSKPPKPPLCVCCEIKVGILVGQGDEWSPLYKMLSVLPPLIASSSLREKHTYCFTLKGTLYISSDFPCIPTRLKPRCVVCFPLTAAARKHASFHASCSCARTG